MILYMRRSFSCCHIDKCIISNLKVNRLKLEENAPINVDDITHGKVTLSCHHIDKCIILTSKLINYSI